MRPCLFNVHFLRYVLMSWTFVSFLESCLPETRRACTRFRSGQDCWICLQAATEASERLEEGVERARIQAGSVSAHFWLNSRFWWDP